jgi:hypothetical protein
MGIRQSSSPRIHRIWCAVLGGAGAYSLGSVCGGVLRRYALRILCVPPLVLARLLHPNELQSVSRVT